MNKKYPASLFIMGLILNLIARFGILTLASVIFLIIGIWSPASLRIGISLLIIALALSFIEQLRIRNAFLSEDDGNPGFKDFQDAVSSGDWRNNIMNLVESKITDENQFEDEKTGDTENDGDDKEND